MEKRPCRSPGASCRGMQNTIVSPMVSIGHDFAAVMLRTESVCARSCQQKAAPPEPQKSCCHMHGDLQGLEKYIMTRIHHYTFAVSALDRERDEALRLRIAALSFVRPEHLDIPAVLQDKQAWVLAMKELHKINDYKVCACRIVHASFRQLWAMLMHSCSVKLLRSSNFS